MDTLEQLRSSVAERYRIERELGAGGMATVYLAEDLEHKRRVAVKVLKPELAAVLGAERFLQEITTTAALQHPHILPLFDSGEADGSRFLVPRLTMVHAPPGDVHVIVNWFPDLRRLFARAGSRP